MARPFTYLKACTRPAFQRMFKMILWNRNLTHGAKVFALSLLTVPPQSKVKLKKLAWKLGTDSSSISRWKKQLVEAKLTVRQLEPLVDTPYLGVKMARQLKK